MVRAREADTDRQRQAQWRELLLDAARCGSRRQRHLRHRRIHDDPGDPIRLSPVVPTMKLSQVIFVFIGFALIQFAPGGSITTIDGKRIEGAVAVESKSALTITPKERSPTRVELSKVLQADMDIADDDGGKIALTRGLVLSDGTALAAA